MLKAGPYPALSSGGGSALGLAGDAWIWLGLLGLLSIAGFAQFVASTIDMFIKNLKPDHNRGVRM